MLLGEKSHKQCFSAVHPTNYYLAMYAHGGNRGETTLRASNCFLTRFEAHSTDKISTWCCNLVMILQLERL